MNEIKLKERSNNLLDAVIHLWLFHSNYLTTGDDKYRLTLNYGRGLSLSAFNRNTEELRLLGRMTIVKSGKDFTENEEEQKKNISELHLTVSFNILEETTEEEYNDIKSRIPILNDEESVLNMEELTEHTRDGINNRTIVMMLVDSGGFDKAFIQRRNWEDKKIFFTTKITKRK